MKYEIWANEAEDEFTCFPTWQRPRWGHSELHTLLLQFEAKTSEDARDYYQCYLFRESASVTPRDLR